MAFLRGVFPNDSLCSSARLSISQRFGKTVQEEKINTSARQQSQNCAASARWKSANANHRAHTHLIISIKHVKQFSISIQALFEQKENQESSSVQFRKNACEMKMSWPVAATRPNNNHTHSDGSVCQFAAFLGLSVVVLAMAKTAAALVDAACS